MTCPSFCFSSRDVTPDVEDALWATRLNFRPIFRDAFSISGGAASRLSCDSDLCLTTFSEDCGLLDVVCLTCFFLFFLIQSTSLQQTVLIKLSAAASVPTSIYANPFSSSSSSKACSHFLFILFWDLHNEIGRPAGNVSCLNFDKMHTTSSQS